MLDVPGQPGLSADVRPRRGRAAWYGQWLTEALLIAIGLDTTSNMIGLACAMLLRHPEQFDAPRADPELIPPAVDELLRIPTIVQHGTVRVATRDVVIGRLKLAEGDGVLCSLVAADHDERIFPDAGRFDVRRDASAHLAFGHGVHQCLGQPLARAELEAVLRPDDNVTAMFAAQTTG